MLQIKTIIKKLGYQNEFDDVVNDALASGWELVRRDFFSDTSTPEHCVFLYAELEREVIVEEEEEVGAEVEGAAGWLFSRRNPLEPYHCSKCGHAANPSKPLPSICPNCRTTMDWGAE